MKRGIVRLAAALKFQLGVVTTRSGQVCAKAPEGKRVTKIVIAAVTTMAIGTANRRANRRPSTQAITIGRTMAG